MSLYGLIVCAALAQGTLPPCVADLDAQETPTPVQQARLLLQAFGFDRALENRGGLKIAVLYAEDLSEAEPMRLAFGEIGSAGVQNMPVTAIAVQFRSVAALLEQFDEEGVTAVYVPEALTTALSSIQQVTRARRLASLAEVRGLVEQGLSMGVFLSEDGLKLIVNRRSMQVEEVDLPAQVLALSEVVR